MLTLLCNPAILFLPFARPLKHSIFTSLASSFLVSGINSWVTTVKPMKMLGTSLVVWSLRNPGYIRCAQVGFAKGWGEQGSGEK